MDIISAATAAEKSAEPVKGFLNKLIGPAADEVGLLIASPFKMRRFRQELKMFAKVKEDCEKNNIKIKQISLKLLLPLTELSSLEEDDEMLYKWSNLLVNLVDSEQNITNHVFPYILSQLSKNEFVVLESLYRERLAKIEIGKYEIEEFRSQRPEREKVFQDRIDELEEEYKKIESPDKNLQDVTIVKTKLQLAKFKLRKLSLEEASIQKRMYIPLVVDEEQLQNFEISNLVRLGLVKEEKGFSARSTLGTPYSSNSDIKDTPVNTDLISYSTIFMTELGELFIQACKERTKKGNSKK